MQQTKVEFVGETQRKCKKYGNKSENKAFLVGPSRAEKKKKKRQNKQTKEGFPDVSMSEATPQVLESMERTPLLQDKTCGGCPSET